FGAWVAVTELVPYLGPWLGAIPPIIYALVMHPLSAVWVALLFLGIHQIEGHVVVPNVMANALRLHPLLVIFGLLAGGELYGLPGVLLALPTMAALRAIWEFFGERVHLEAWEEEEPVVPVDFDVEPPNPPAVRASRRRRTAPQPPPPLRRAPVGLCIPPPPPLPPAYISRMASFPVPRLRRLRRTDALRSLARETRLEPDRFVMPLFACPGEGVV